MRNEWEIKKETANTSNLFKKVRDRVESRRKQRKILLEIYLANFNH